MKELETMTDQELAELLQKAKSVSTLPYIASPKQMEFHTHPARGLDKAVLYGGKYVPRFAAM